MGNFLQCEKDDDPERDKTKEIADKTKQVGATTNTATNNKKSPIGLSPLRLSASSPLLNRSPASQNSNQSTGTASPWSGGGGNRGGRKLKTKTKRKRKRKGKFRKKRKTRRNKNKKTTRKNK